MSSSQVTVHQKNFSARTDVMRSLNFIPARRACFFFVTHFTVSKIINH